MQTAGGRAIGRILQGEKFVLGFFNDFWSDRRRFPLSSDGFRQSLGNSDQAGFKG